MELSESKAPLSARKYRQRKIGLSDHPNAKSPDSSYSHLSATIGSTRAARRDGTQLASTAAARSKTFATTNVVPSKACTPNSQLFSSRVTTCATSRPTVKLLIPETLLDGRAF